MMLMNVNGFLLHYVGSMQWDLEMFDKKWKQKSNKQILFNLNNANECEWFSSSLCTFPAMRLRNSSEKKINK